MSDLHLSNNNNNNNNSNSASEQDLISGKPTKNFTPNNEQQQQQVVLRGQRALASSGGGGGGGTIMPATSNRQLGEQQQQRKLSHHLSHHQLGQTQLLVTGNHQTNLQLQNSSTQPNHHNYNHHHHHHSHQHLQMAANLISVGGKSSAQIQNGAAASFKEANNGKQVSKSASSLVQVTTNTTTISGNSIRSSNSNSSSSSSSSSSNSSSHQQKQKLQTIPVDRSDSASLPSSTSTSESMFKQRLGGNGKWLKLFTCGSSQNSSSTARFFRLTLLFILLLLAVGLLLMYFKLLGFSISCSYYGSGKQSDGFNLKNGAEFYMGITEMLQAMDNTVDPCHDFYNYACGAWTRRHSIPGDESRIDTFSVMRTDLSNKLKDLLEEDVDSSDSEATIKAKTLYKSCINESLIDQRGPEPLIQLLNNMFGGWPLLNADSQLSTTNSADSSSTTPSSLSGIDTQNWVQLMAILRTYNNEIIIGQTVGSHEHNSSMHAIRLYPAGLGLPSADYYNSSSRQFKAYEKYMISTAQLLKANNTNLLSDIKDVLEFETGLANISKPFERQGGATYHRMTIARLQKYTPAIDWDTYFKYSFPDVSINSTEQIGLYGLDFFMDIAHLINQTSSKKTVINYLLWRFVMNRVNNLGKQFADNQHEYAAEISGAKQQAPRHKVCVDYVNGNMGMAVSSLYVKRHFDAGSKHQAEIMIANIRQAFLDILDQVDWMDAETRSEAIVKAKSMLQHIGFPMWIIDPPQLDQEYSHLNFSSENYFENVIQLIQSFAKETRSKLRQPSERDKWTVAPSIINAHYLRTKNLMSFPAGILQPPIYHTRYPKSLNYGGIGSIIGHEITHGFDNDGRHHDYQGNQRLWWHPNTIDRFIIRSQCMVRQYDDYSVEIRGENVTVSGVRTLGENIADNGGLKEAFMAYRRYEFENGPEDSLPGLNLTHHQMFFIKFAQNWCQNMTPQSMMNALKTWRHPLGKFRVMGTLSNLNEFSTAFNCPPSTPMNPSNKCKVW